MSTKRELDTKKRKSKGKAALHDKGKVYLYAFVHWFNTYRCSCDSDTGMWIVHPTYKDAAKRQPHLAVIHVNTIFHGLHLVPVYNSQSVPCVLKFYHSLDLYTAFYVNKYTDYHANETMIQGRRLSFAAKATWLCVIYHFWLLLVFFSYFCLCIARTSSYPKYSSWEL